MILSAPKKPASWLIDNIEKANIADQFSDTILAQIGSDIISNVQIDDGSRFEWKEKADGGMKVAKQTIEPKSYPWPNAANTKDPLIAVAMMQFAARSGAEVIRGRDIVKTQITGDDSLGIKEARGKRVGQFMSYQCLDQMEEWESDTDQLLTSVSGFGLYYKKTYRDELLGRSVSCAVSPMKVVVHDEVKSLATAERVSEKMQFNRNETIERIRAELWIDILDKLGQDTETFDDFIECHCWYDLDGDGYKEPYVITVSEPTGQVVRIAARYESDGVLINKKKEVIRIKALEYFTEFCFLPSPDGKFHKMGFFQLLGALNEEINTIQNQLIDAGTLANQQGGFIGKGARLPSGSLRLKPGEWKPVETTGAALRDSIFALPAKDPSSVMFNLLGRLDDKGMKLSNVSETMMGEQPGQNSPATTTLAVLDQGLKVFSSILKRLFRAFKSEYKKLYRLNYLHLTDKEYLNVIDLSAAEIQALVPQLGGIISETSRFLVEYDFNPATCDLQPILDPTASSEALRLKRAEALVQSDPMNPEIRKDYYKMLGVPESRIAAYLPPPDPNAPPPPEIIQIQADIEQKKQQGEVDHQNAQNAATKLEQEEDMLPYRAKLLEAQALSLKAQTMKTQAETAQLPINMQLTIMQKQFDEYQNQFGMELEMLKHKFDREATDGVSNAIPGGIVSGQGDGQGEPKELAGDGGNASGDGAPPDGTGLPDPGIDGGAGGSDGTSGGGEMDLPSGLDTGNRPYTTAADLASTANKPGSMI